MANGNGQPGRLANGAGTAGTVGAGGGVIAYLVNAGVDPVLSTSLVAFGAFLVGVAAKWAREKIEAGDGSLPMRLLAALGVLVLAIGISGCAAQLGPGNGWVSWSLWEHFNVEGQVSPPGFCIGCREATQGGEQCPEPPWLPPPEIEE